MSSTGKITIDGKSIAYSVARKALIALLGATACASGVAYFAHQMQLNRDATESSVCTGRMKTLAIGLQHFQESNQARLPPAYLIGPDGKRWHSWRVLILPYLSEEQLYSEYRFDEPWDGPNNSKLASRMPKFYGCPSDAEAAARGETNYFVIVGKGTAFPDDGTRFPFHWSNGEGLSPAMISAWLPHSKPLMTKEGKPLLRSPGNTVRGLFPRPSETLLVVESAGRGINWLDPRDLEYDSMSFRLNAPNRPGISSPHRHSLVHVAFADSFVRSYRELDPEALRRMCLVDPDKKPDAPQVGKAFAE